MGWFKKTMMRGAVNRANKRLEAEFGEGFGTATLAVAIGSACYPDATLGDGGIQDEIVLTVRKHVPPLCDAQTACQCVEMWLDKGAISTEELFYHVWGMGTEDFMEWFAAAVKLNEQR